jgi:NTP pyrophosphatase (non-canonical NTP hydrolase)
MPGAIDPDEPMTADLPALTRALRQFAAERNWEPFHSPKNLAAALSVEAAELLEHFQWLTEAQSRALPADQREAVGHEMADVLLYLLQLADKLDIDLLGAARRKMVLNAEKYPLPSARGNNRKDTAP